MSLIPQPLRGHGMQHDAVYRFGGEHAFMSNFYPSPTAVRATGDVAFAVPYYKSPYPECYVHGWVGQNLLGRFLMERRDVLRSGRDRYQEDEP